MAQNIANDTTSWFLKNDMVVSGEKSKLMTIGTQQNKLSKIVEGGIHHLGIVMDGKAVNVSSSEKLLGIVVNDKLSWKNHLYGDTSNPVS